MKRSPQRARSVERDSNPWPATISPEHELGLMATGHRLKRRRGVRRILRLHRSVRRLVETAFGCDITAAVGYLAGNGRKRPSARRSPGAVESGRCSRPGGGRCIRAVRGGGRRIVLSRCGAAPTGWCIPRVKTHTLARSGSGELSSRQSSVTQPASGPDSTDDAKPTTRWGLYTPKARLSYDRNGAEREPERYDSIFRPSN